MLWDFNDGLVMLEFQNPNTYQLLGAYSVLCISPRVCEGYVAPTLCCVGFVDSFSRNFHRLKSTNPLGWIVHFLLI